MSRQHRFLVEKKRKQHLGEPYLSPQNSWSQGCRASGNFLVVQDEAWGSGPRIQEGPLPQFITQSTVPCDLPAQGSPGRCPRPAPAQAGRHKRTSRVSGQIGYLIRLHGAPVTISQLKTLREATNGQTAKCEGAQRAQPHGGNFHGRN